MRPIELVAVTAGAVSFVRHKRRRLAKTVVGALLGAAVGWVLFTMTDSGLARR